MADEVFFCISTRSITCDRRQRLSHFLGSAALSCLSEVVASALLLFGCTFGLRGLLLSVSLERDELTHQVLIDIHDSRVIVEVTAIVFRTEYGYQLLVLAEETVSVLHNLMSTADQVKVVPAEEVLQLWSAEHVTTATLILLPISDLIIGVVPKQVSHKTLVRNVCWLRYTFYLLEAVHMHRNTAVHAHNLLVDKRYKRHVVE